MKPQLTPSMPTKHHEIGREAAAALGNDLPSTVAAPAVFPPDFESALEPHLMDNNSESSESVENMQAFIAPDYGSWDYMRLPDHGRYHYSLENAALLVACDWWAEGKIGGFPPTDDWVGDFDTPQVRKSLEPTRTAVCELLLRAVEKGICDAEVLGRDASSSAPLSNRTFITLTDLINCLEEHGHSVGDFLLGKIQEESEDRQSQAELTAESRAEFRHAHQVNDRIGTWSGIDEADALRAQLKAQTLEITHLKLQLISGAPHRPVEKLATREKNGLLLTIAAACRFAGLDFKKPHKTAEILCDSAAELGVDHGASTVEKHLKAIPTALMARSRAAQNKGF